MTILEWWVSNTHTHIKNLFASHTISKAKCFLLSSIVLPKPHCLITWLYIPSTAAKGPLVNACRPTFWGLECFYSNSSKNLGSLGNLGPVHESCTLFIGIHGNLGPVQVLWRSYVELCVFSKKKMHFPCVFLCWTSEFLQMVFILVEFPKMESRILVLHSWVFFETDDCNRNYFTYSDCIQKTLVFTVVFACATVWKMKIFRYIWSNTPPSPR